MVLTRDSKKSIRARLRVITLGVGQGDSWQELRQIAVRAEMEHHVPVVRHQAVSQNAHRHKIQTLCHEGEKPFVMLGLLEKPGTKIRAVQDVINRIADIESLDSPPFDILALVSRKENGS